MKAGLYGRQSKGNKKRISDQLFEGRLAVSSKGWSLAWEKQDAVGASHRSRGKRSAWPEVLAELEDGSVDILILWEVSRADRKLTAWSTCVDLCRDKGIRLFVVEDETLYDPREDRDWEYLINAGVRSELEVRKLARRVRSGIDGAARAGRPAGGSPSYGFIRTHDERTGELTGQHVDPAKLETIRRMFKAVAARQSLTALAADLNAEGERTATGALWTQLGIRRLVANPAYMGKREHRGEMLDGDWEGAVTEEEWYAASRVLADPKRRTHGVGSDPGRQKHLLTWLAECGKCSGPITARELNRSYNCKNKGCCQLNRSEVDSLISELAIARLSSPEVYRSLKQKGEADDRELVRAHKDKADAHKRLAAYEARAIKGTITDESFERIAEGIQKEIASAQAAIERLSVPSTLRAYVGRREDVEGRWAAATVLVRRDLLRALGITVQMWPGPRLSVEERVTVNWE